MLTELVTLLRFLINFCSKITFDVLILPEFIEFTFKTVYSLNRNNIVEERVPHVYNS